MAGSEKRTGLGARCGMCQVQADLVGSSPSAALLVGPRLLHRSPKVPTLGGRGGMYFLVLHP